MPFKNQARTLCGFVLAVALLFTSGTTGFATIVTAAASGTESQYASKLNDLEKKSSELDKEIRALKEDKSKKEQLKSQLQRKVANTNEQIDICTQKVSELDKEIKYKEAEIAIKEEELETNKELFKQRLRAMYMSGGNSELLILLGSEDFADFLSKSELTRSVSEHDQQMMQDIADAVKVIEEGIKSVEADKTAQTDAKKTLAGKQRDLKDQMSEIDGMIAEINDQSTDLATQQAEYQKAMDQVEADMAAAREQARIAAKKKKEEAERKAAEQKKKDEEAKKNSSDGSGSSANSSNGSSSSSGSKVSSGMFLWPVNGFYNISSPYGYRIHPVTKKYSLHTGIDIAGAGIAGKPILASDDGVVMVAKYNSGYGNYVVLYHGTASNGIEYETLYGHMTRYVVGVGDYVTKGQTIGYVGTTGTSTGNHLHFEIHENGATVNPEKYFN